MRKSIVIFLFLLCLCFNTLALPVTAQPTRVIKRGFYSMEDLHLSPNVMYTVRNTSFNERIFLLIFDSSQNVLQAIRLWPQSQKFNLVPLQPGYKIVITGDGEVTFTA